MARTKKLGVTGRFGPRYGRKANRTVKTIEENMKRTTLAHSVIDLELKGLLQEYGNAENVVQSSLVSIPTKHSHGQNCLKKYKKDCWRFIIVQMCQM